MANCLVVLHMQQPLWHAQHRSPGVVCMVAVYSGAGASLRCQLANADFSDTEPGFVGAVHPYK